MKEGKVETIVANPFQIKIIQGNLGCRHDKMELLDGYDTGQFHCEMMPDIHGNKIYTQKNY